MAGVFSDPPGPPNLGVGHGRCAGLQHRIRPGSSGPPDPWQDGVGHLANLNPLDHFLLPLLNSGHDLLPIVVAIAFCQLVILQQAIPDIGPVTLGVLLVIIGLARFVRGLETGLFPIGETMAYAFARKGSVSWLLIFAFALGFGTTIAEPALITVAEEAAVVAATGHVIADTDAARESYRMS